MDGQIFGAEIVEIVKDYLARNLTLIIARLDAAEKRFAELPVPKDGQDADPEKVAAIVADKMAADITELRAAVGAIAIPEMPDVAGMIAEVIAAIPAPENGKDADPVLIKRMIDEAVAALPPAAPGKDADPIEVEATIKTEVERAVAAIERPQDGKSVTVDELRPIIDETIVRAVAAIPVPKDGANGKDAVGLAGALIDRSGSLVLTLADGTTCALGQVIGKDGDPGKPGRDGVGFDDLDVVETEKGMMIRFKQTDTVKEFPLPVPLDRGVYKDGVEYHRGAVVSFGGSAWIAQEATSAKPGDGVSWRLSVKKGRDGKDGILKAEAPKTPVKVG